MAAAALFLQACTGGPPTPGSPSAAGTRYRLQVTPASFQLAAPVQREVAVAKGSTIYLAGGLDAGGSSAAGVFSLDPASGSLHQVGTVPNAFHDAGGGIMGGSLVIFGGGATASSDAVQSFDPASGKGAVIGHLPRPLSDLSAVTVGTTAYVVGGYDGTTARPEIYSTQDGRTFRVAGRLPQGLRYPAVGVADGLLVIAGGETSAGVPVAGVWTFDPSSGRVRSLGTMSTAVGHAAAWSLANTVYVAGGLDRAGRALKTIWAIDPRAGTVVQAGSLPGGLSDAGVAVVEGRAWIIGGWRGTALSTVLSAALVPVTTTPSATPSAADPASVRPFAGLLLIADRGNNRLLVIDASKHVLWRYPDPSLPTPPFRFFYPDDAFWVHGGHAILVNEEGNQVIEEIGYPSGRVLWTYGTPGVAGSSKSHLHEPDDAYPYGSGVIVADASNCRILVFDSTGAVQRQIGTPGSCAHDPPSQLGAPNGDTPLPDGSILVSEVRTAFIEQLTPEGKVVWATHVAGITYPSDPQRLPDGSFLAVGYQSPGVVARFDQAGHILWKYGPTSGPGVLDHPSLAAPLPNGLVAVVDDYGDRILIIDPATNRIVWHYGSHNQPGTASGLLHTPDGFDLLFPDGTVPLHVDFPSSSVTPGRP